MILYDVVSGQVLTRPHDVVYQASPNVASDSRFREEVRL